MNIHSQRIGLFFISSERLTKLGTSYGKRGVQIHSL